MDLKNKRVTVFGIGISGMSALKLLHLKGAKLNVISKGDPISWPNKSEIEKIIGNNINLFCYQDDSKEAQKVILDSDWVILSPGIPREHPLLTNVLKNGIPVISEIELGYQYIKGKGTIIAITGTNGKTTTVTLLAEILKEAGFKVFLGGNIGTPLTELSFALESGQITAENKPDFLVLELSSFQLESMIDFRPNIGAILNVTRGHGERYKNVEDYSLAKKNISKNMTSGDIILYPDMNSLFTEWSKTHKAKNIPINFENISLVKNSLEKEFNLSEFKMIGAHNYINLYFCYKIIENLDVPKAAFQKVINTFPGIHHRMEEVFPAKNLPFRIINDSKSTNWDATISGINSLTGQDIFLIVGGKFRGGGDDITPFLPSLRRSVKKIFLIGESSQILEKEIGKEIPYKICGDIKSALMAFSLDLDKLIAKENLIKEKIPVLLFSPGFPSFDQFKDYGERGDQFKSFSIEIFQNFSKK